MTNPSSQPEQNPSLSWAEDEQEVQAAGPELGDDNDDGGVNFDDDDVSDDDDDDGDGDEQEVQAAGPE